MVVILPEFLHLPDEAAYRQHWEDTFVIPSPHTIWDGSRIWFYSDRFDHTFTRDLSLNSGDRDWNKCRLKRMNWILPMLQDPGFDRFVDDRKVDRFGYGARCQVIEHSTPFCIVVKPITAIKTALITVMCVDTSESPVYKSAYKKIIEAKRW
jgi:hypothetical protein